MIYVASRNDLPEIVKMALEIPKELPSFGNFPSTDTQKVSDEIFQNWLTMPVFVYKPDTEIQGFIATKLSQLWWSSENIITDFAWYVKPEYRNNAKVFSSLITSLGDFGRLNKMKVITNFMSDTKTEVKQRMFEKAGFKHSGFIMTLGFN